MAAAWLVAFVMAVAQSLGQPALAGQVTDEMGNHHLGSIVVLYPADPFAWTSSDPSKFQEAVLLFGRFALGKVPPDTYRIAVLDTTESGIWRTADFLRTLEPRSVQIRLERQSETVEVIAAGAFSDRPQLREIRHNGSVTVNHAAADLPKRVTLSGTVVDEDGRPVPGAFVSLFRVRDAGRITQLIDASRQVRTDDRGRYVLDNLTSRSGVFLGVVAYSSDPQSASQWRRGGPASVRQPDGGKLGYVTTFYPNATSYEDAQSITIGDEDLTLSVTLARRPVVDVTGSISPNPGALVIQLVPTNPADQVGIRPFRQVVVSPEGRFEIPDVPFGRYVIISTSARAPFRRPITVDGSLEPVLITAPPTLKGTVRP